MLGDFQTYMGCFKVWHNLTRVLKPCTNHPELNIFWMYKSFSPFSSSDCNIYLYHWQVYLFSIKRACKCCLFFKYLVEKNIIDHVILNHLTAGHFGSTSSFEPYWLLMSPLLNNCCCFSSRLGHPNTPFVSSVSATRFIYGSLDQILPQLFLTYFYLWPARFIKKSKSSLYSW